MSSLLEFVLTCFPCSETEGKNGEPGPEKGGRGKWRRKQIERARVLGRSVLENFFFRFYALLAERFSLRIRRASGHGARRSTRTLVTVLTALTIHLFQAETFLMAFLRVFQRALSPSRFFMLFSFIFRHLESFFVVFYFSFYSHLTTGLSTRDRQ